MSEIAKRQKFFGSNLIGLRPCLVVGIASRLQDTNRKEGESKRAREQEGKRRSEDVKM